MEEYEAYEHPLIDVTNIEKVLSSKILSVAEKQKDILSCKELILLREGDKYNATLTCIIDKTKTLGEVHQIISRIESVLFMHFKQLKRITIHAEPK
jgi:divalent metal cation (Fe/Co/Zn/Cd) transporter